MTTSPARPSRVHLGLARRTPCHELAAQRRQALDVLPEEHWHQALDAWLQVATSRQIREQWDPCWGRLPPWAAE